MSTARTSPTVHVAQLKSDAFELVFKFRQSAGRRVSASNSLLKLGPPGSPLTSAGGLGRCLVGNSQVLSFRFVRSRFIHCRMARMNTHRQNALVAILARIDKQIVESDTLLLKAPTGRALLRVTDELAYLQIERRDVAAKLGNIN